MPARHYIFLIAVGGMLLQACQTPAQKSSESTLQFHTLDTDFSKGRLGLQQTVDLGDLVKFHGHLCDGLVVGALAMDTTFKHLFGDGPIDRTNLRIVSKPSPCLTDVAIYLTGGRYQFNTFYVDTGFEGLFMVQRLDNGVAYAVDLASGIKPAEIDSLGSIAVQQNLPPCELDRLQRLEDDFTDFLLHASNGPLFVLRELPNFVWHPNPKNDYLKTDILNKDAPVCRH
jgi:formylmethanofuran dehydrogenase subunit E